MNCTGFRKYVGAFADGELDVRNNLEVLEHLNMCPACAKRVEEVNSLKNALKRIWGDQRAPQELRARVVASLGGDEISPLAKAPRLREARGRRLRIGLLVPLAAAAALLIAVTSRHYRAADGVAHFGLTAITARTTADVRKQHRLCIITRGLNHHDPSLSRDPATIAERLSARLGLDVIAPDLSAAGFELVGADRCGIIGRPGAHVLYREFESGVMLSLYTVGRIAEFSANYAGSTAKDAHGYFTSTDEALTVVAWDNGGVTHVACGKIEKAHLIETLDRIRVAELAWLPQFLAGIGIAAYGPAF